MLGSDFVEKVREYLLSVGEEAQGIAVIPRFVLYFLFFVYIYVCVCSELNACYICFG